MLINVRGRVESDPMRIPTPASMSDGDQASFESMLQEAQEAAPEPRIEAPAAETPTPAEPEVVEDQAPETPPARDDQPSCDDTPVDGMFTVAPAITATVVPAEPNETLRRGETERQTTAGKGTASPRTSSSEDLLAAIVQRSAPPNPQLVPTNAIVAPTTVKASEPRIGGLTATSAARANLASRAPAVTAGYRANGKVSAELLDQARDSVFKQILMKLTDGGGEMRVRLDPPELGELDLHVLVAKGNVMNLGIAAERSDVAELLQRHLPELCSALQANGLQIADAQVQTRSERDAHADDSAHGGAERSADAIDQDLVAVSSSPRSGGWISADGLDFWA